MVVPSGSQNGSQSDLRITSRSRGVRRCRADRESVRGGLPDAGMIRAALWLPARKPTPLPSLQTEVRRFAGLLSRRVGACDTPAKADERDN
jgi:hypothetical protein